MKCFISPRRTRTLFQFISFGAILLWIVFGTYTHEVPAERLSSRHLLALSGVESELTLTKTQCSDLNMRKEPSGELVNLDDDQCSSVHNLGSNFSACDFIHCVDSCSSGGGIFNYLNFIYCKLPAKLIPLAMIILFFWLIFLFIFLGATAEEYFCPALTVISSVMRLSQNVAGVTLLALGNGAPDIFSAFAAVNQDEDAKASLAVGALFGAGIFVTTIVVGAVTVTKPFVLTQRPFLRDIIFYIFAAFWTFCLLWSNSMTIYSAVGFVVLYLFYVVVVILGRVIFQKWKKWRTGNKLGTGDMPSKRFKK